MSTSNYKPFKYATEAGINMSLANFWVCQQEDFKYIKDDPFIPFYNIYFICQRNRVNVQPKSMKVTKSKFHFDFEVHEEHGSFMVPASFPNPFNSTQIKIESEYPHEYFMLKNKIGDKLLVKSSHILDEGRRTILPNADFLDLEVMYVGQTQRISKTPILERLEKHSTLQQILSAKRPDKAIYLVLCQFSTSGMIETRGTVRTQKKYEKEDRKRLLSFMKSRLQLTLKQQIDLTEAALIKYFEPEYNNKLKQFPKTKTKSYNFIYKMDLNAVSIEINTDIHYFSKKINTSNKHFQRFYLSSDKERRKFVDFSVGFDTVPKRKKNH